MTLLYWYLLPLLPIGMWGLWFAYRRRGRGRPRVVSSVLLLKKLAQLSTARARFVPPWRFYLEMAALLLLGCLAAGLRWNTEGPRVALVIDTSLSTASKPSGGGGTDSLGARTAFEEIISAAKIALLDLPADSRIALFASAPRLTPVSDGMIDVRGAATLLDSLRWRFAPDSLANDLQKLAHEGRFEKIIAVTDRRGGTDASHDRQVDYITPPALLAPLQNVALESLAVQKSEGRVRAFVRVRLYTSGPVRGSVIVEELAPGEVWRERDRRSFEGQSGESREIEFGWTDTERETGTVRARLEVSPANRADALDKDNVVYGVGKGGQSQIAVYSDLGVGELGLDDLSLFDFMAGEERGIDAATLPDARALLFHRRSTSFLPPIPSLFVLPPEEGIFRTEGALGGMELVRWDDMHPLMHYLNLPLLNLARVGKVAGPLWSEDVMRGSRGTLVLAGEHEGARYVAVGFELFPYQGGRSPILSVFLLNALRWLVAERGVSGVSVTENELVLPDDVRAVSYLGGEGLVIDRQGPHPVVTPPHPGILTVRGGAGSETRIAVDPQTLGESDLRSGELPAIPISPPSISGSSVPHLGDTTPGGALAAIFASLAVGAMLIDLLIVMRSRTV